jgi:hypothetical protein
MIGKYALSAAALLQLANRANGQIYFGDLNDDVSSEDWASVAESANFTQTTTFTGRDVSGSYPGESQDDWSLHFAIKDDLEGANDKQLTAGTISLSGPDGAVEFDDSWELCVHVFNVKESSSGGFGSATDSCSGIVAPECVEDLLKDAISNYAEGCSAYKTTPSCLRDIQEDTDGSYLAINADNAEDYIGNGTTIFRRTYAEHDAEQDSPTVLLSAGAQAQAVVTIFGTTGDSEEEPYGQITCVLPDTAENDTVDPTAEDAAAGLTAFAGWAALTAAVAYQLL